MTSTPWAVIRCKWKGSTATPLSDNYFQNLFTTSGAGTDNMVEYFDAMSHGRVDLSGSRVFGWYELPRPQSDYAGNVATPPTGKINRGGLVSLARQTATDNGVDLSRYYGSVIFMNTPTDLFGQLGGPAAVCDGSNVQPSMIGQEMAHVYGLDHSRRAGSTEDYRDDWDVMSTLSSCHMRPGTPYGLSGPGLNAANMRSRGWLDRSRVLSLRSSSGGFTRRVQLRPLHARELPGYLAVEVDDYVIELREQRRWDALIPNAAVFVHSFEDNHSYIEPAASGRLEILAGDRWELGQDGVADLPFTRVVVDRIDPAARSADLLITHRPGHNFSNDIHVGGMLGTPWVDGGGFIGVGDTGLIVNPGSPLVGVAQHLVAYQTVAAMVDANARNATQAAAMQYLAEFARSELERLDAPTFRSPAPLAERSGEEPPAAQ